MNINKDKFYEEMKKKLDQMYKSFEFTAVHAVLNDFSEKSVKEALITKARYKAAEEMFDHCFMVLNTSEIK